MVDRGHAGEGREVVIDTTVPFEELSVGDVIVFKERPEHRVAKESIHVNIEKVPSDSSDSVSSGSTIPLSEDNSATQDDTSQELNPENDTEPIVYFRNQAVLHRIVAINTILRGVSDTSDTGCTKLTTQGDGNESPDPVPVVESGYIGKMVIKMDYAGKGTKILYENFHFILAGTILMSILTALISRSNVLSRRS